MNDTPNRPEPPHRCIINTSVGVEILVSESYGEVLDEIEEAYKRSNPFIQVNDNYGRGVSVPVGVIVLVREP